jgi:hypothetical protein
MKRARIPVFLLLLLVPIAIGISACRPKYNPTPVYTLFNDFESASGSINDPSGKFQLISTDEAYSGQQVCGINKSQDTCFYYKSKLGNISDKKISWIKISGYCMAKSDKLNKAAVECRVQDESKTYKSQDAVFLQRFTEGKKNKWIYFERSFNLSMVSKPEYTINTFVLTSDSSDEVLIDDLKIEFFN